MNADLTNGQRYAGVGQRQPERYPATDALRARYGAYRLRQGRELLALVPREVVRELHRRMLDEHGSDSDIEPIQRLAGFCADLLPLPPFDEWVQDFHRHRDAYLAETEPPLSEGPSAPNGEPVAVDVRAFWFHSCEWIAGLWVLPDAEGWRGAIHFHDASGERAVRTADIFREAHLTTVRERFRMFDGPTLEAFLRSALP